MCNIERFSPVAIKKQVESVIIFTHNCVTVFWSPPKKARKKGKTTLNELWYPCGCNANFGIVCVFRHKIFITWRLVLGIVWRLSLSLRRFPLLVPRFVLAFFHVLLISISTNFCLFSFGIQSFQRTKNSIFIVFSFHLLAVYCKCIPIPFHCATLYRLKCVSVANPHTNTHKSQQTNERNHYMIRIFKERTKKPSMLIIWEADCMLRSSVICTMANLKM